MNQRLFIALLTVAMFGAGYMVGTQSPTSDLHVPPPPVALVKELASTPSAPEQKSSKDIDRAKLAKLIAYIEKNLQQTETYRAQVDEIYQEFDREFLQILTPAQKEKYLANQANNQKRMAEEKAKHKGEPLTDDFISAVRNQPMTDVYWMVTVTPHLDRLTKEVDLDASQQMSVRSLLNLRRNKFISLLDSTPSPGVRLSKLAPMIKQLQEMASPQVAK